MQRKDLVDQKVYKNYKKKTKIVCRCDLMWGKKSCFKVSKHLTCFRHNKQARPARGGHQLGRPVRQGAAAGGAAA